MFTQIASCFNDCSVRQDSEVVVPNLLALTGQRFVRQVLKQPGAALVSGDISELVVTDSVPEPQALSPHAAAVIVVTADGAAFHLVVNGCAWLNAETQPAGPLRRLADKDRMTYHNGGDSPVLRVWYLQDGASTTYGGAPANLACGYCAQPFTLGETLTACTCGETLHVECAQHGGNHCPRCKNPLAAADATWWPDGFTLQDEAEDDW